MTATHHHLFRGSAGASTRGNIRVVAQAEPVVRSVAARRVLATLRLAFGFTFLWAFFDKLLALGYATGTAPDGSVDRFGDAAWIHGGSPTEASSRTAPTDRSRTCTTTSPAPGGPTGCS